MSSSEKTTNWLDGLAKMGTMAVFLILLAFAFSPSLHAQGFNDGGVCGTSSARPCLGDFVNPLTVTDSLGATCNYDYIQFDMSQGKVFVRPYKNSSGGACTGNVTNAGTSGLVEITNLANPVSGTGTPGPQTPFSGVTSGTISASGSGAVTDGVFQVHSFHLQLPSNFGTNNNLHNYYGYHNGTIYLTGGVIANADNTPVMLISSGDVNVDTGVQFYFDGAPGSDYSGFVPGTGGAGGPGGYRGGNGGNGTSTPSAGATGFGPGGGIGGTVGCNNATGAQYLTTGESIPLNGTSTAVPAGTDISTILRGGSGGGGGGGCSSRPGGGGGGGGGAVLFASSGTITVNGYISAFGGSAPSGGSAGSGGTIRLVAATIAGSGEIVADDYCCSSVGSAGGSIRFEAFSITFNGQTPNIYYGGSRLATTSAPGQIVLPSAVPVTLQFALITDGSTNSCTIGSTNPCYNQAALQAAVGRTGALSSPDVTMPNPGGTPASSVNVSVVLNSSIGSAVTALSGKILTLVVAPQDPGQGASKTYQLTISCTSMPCTQTFSSVSLPLGFSSLSAFAYVNISSGGALSQMFPRRYQGEEIENVRLQTNGKETQYVLVSKTGREFTYKPGSGGVTVAARGSAILSR